MNILKMELKNSKLVTNVWSFIMFAFIYRKHDNARGFAQRT